MRIEEEREKKMILFAADNHYGRHPGRVLFENIASDYDISFHEDDWDCFNHENLAERHVLIMLNMIGGSCNVPAPGQTAEKNLRAYLQAGRPLFLLHGASAAFWQCDWWRPLTGFRWVRNNDPDGFAPSTHPTMTYRVDVSKSRHPLCKHLHPVTVPDDELYIELEQTRPAVTLMQTKTDMGSFPMCYETITPWKGRIAGYLPGHAPHAVKLPGNIANCRAIMNWLLAAPPPP